MIGQLRMLAPILASQFVCLFLGLWIHGRMLVTTLSHNADALPADATTAATFEAVGRQVPVISLVSFIWISLLQGAAAYLILTRMQGDYARRQRETEQTALAQMKDLLRTRDAVIFGLAKLAESRDHETGNHLERISLYSTEMASALRRDPRFRDAVTGQFVSSIGISSALHDIGKVAVEDAILLKPGRLTDDERARMETHTTVGAECLMELERRLGESNFLGMAREIAYSHHERWDGTGYPRRLRGEQIPLAARIVSIVDVYDALASKRVYKPALPHEECVRIIREGAGTQFDPDLVEVFLQLEPRMREIADRLASSSNAAAVEPVVVRPAPSRCALPEPARVSKPLGLNQPHEAAGHRSVV